VHRYEVLIRRHKGDRRKDRLLQENGYLAEDVSDDLG
jgi:hypothetical protein